MENKIWGIDLTGRKMWYKPWPVDQNNNFINPDDKQIEEIYCKSGEAVRETLLYFEECGGNTDNLIKLLNEHAIDNKYKITREKLLDKSRWYNNEYYFYFIMFTKKVIGRYDFHYGENNNNPLSVYHCIYEKGFIEFIPWGKDEENKTIKETSSLSFNLIYKYLKNYYSDQILNEFINFLNCVLLKQNKKIDISYFKNTNYWFSVEIPSFYNTFLPILTNDNHIFYKISSQQPTGLILKLFLANKSIKSIYKNVQNLANKYQNLIIYDILELKNNSAVIQFTMHNSKRFDKKYAANFWHLVEQFNIGVFKSAPTFVSKTACAEYTNINSFLKGHNKFKGKFKWKNKKKLLNPIEIIINIIFSLLIITSFILLKNKYLSIIFLLIFSNLNFIYYLIKKNYYDKNILKKVTIDFEEINKSKDELTAKLQNEKDMLEFKVHSRTKELIEANKKLKELDKAKSNFFANISHEIRTPLTLILGPLKSILDGTYGNKINIKENIFESIYKNGNRLLKLINNLLDFSKIEVGKMKLIKEPVDIIKLLKLFYANVESACKAKNINLTFDSDIENLIMNIDINLFEKVFFNVFGNAFKFTPEGGKISILAEQNNNNFIFKIKDTGIGIPENKLDMVFERFSQVDDTSTRSYEGTGIGLSLTKEIIELHKGKINVKSKEGKGSTFTISIPIDINKNTSINKINEIIKIKDELLTEFENKDTIKTNIKYKHNNKTILIVEDNIDMTNYLISLLENEYNIYTASNGNEGIEKINNMPSPDLIISDIMMPILDGREFHNKICENEKYNKIPFIFLTAKKDNKEKIKSFKNGAIDYICKPFDKKELKLKIYSLLKSYENHKESILNEIINSATSLSENTKNTNVVISNKFENADITKKEREVITLILEGLENKEIASELNISIFTVRNHIKNIYKKFKVNNRIDLINFIKHN